MPAKKKTQTPIQKQVKQVEQTVQKPVEHVNKVEQNVEKPVSQEGQKRKKLRKAGRTVYVASNNKDFFIGAVGMTSNTTTSKGGSFLTFDTVKNSLEFYRKFRQEHPDVRIKFSHYKVFFKVNGLVDGSDYGKVKQQLVSHVEKSTNGNVLYFKLYRQNDKYLGCGEMTIDSKETMGHLLNKDSKFKTFEIDGLTGTFYRYSRKKTDEVDETTA